jgi:thiol reductant ABC exporter CydC subunit
MTATTSTRTNPAVRSVGEPPRPPRLDVLDQARHTRRRIAAAGLLGGVATASGVALTATSGWLIARAAERPLILTLMTAIVAVRTFGIARPVFRYWERLVSHDAALATLAAKRTAAYEALIPLTPARLGRRRRSDVLTAVVHDISDEVDAQVRVTVPVVSSAVAGAIAIGFTTAIAPRAGTVVALLVVAVVVISALALQMESRTLHALVQARGEVVRVSELVTSQASELRAVGGWVSATRWLDEAHGDLTKATTAAARGRALAAGAFLLVVAVATVAMAFLTTGLAVSGPVQALLVLTPVAISDAIAPLADAMRARAHARAAAERTSELLTQDPAVADGPADVPADAPLSPEAPGTGDDRPDGEGTPGAFAGLGVADVTASWSAGPDAPRVGPFSLDVAPGQRIAVVGPNGSGKSTLLAVLARHLDPASGSYRVSTAEGDRDVLTEPLDDARSRFAVVDDEPHVFATTLRNNLTLARAGATDDQVLDALERAGLGGLVPSLPEGLDTVLGAGGRGVSGGERARLAIARAHLSGRPVILLDEPVAHLDPPTANSVLADLFSDRTTNPPTEPTTSSDRLGTSGPAVVMVTHRPEGLHLVDHVFSVTRPHR